MPRNRTKDTPLPISSDIYEVREDGLVSIDISSVAILRYTDILLSGPTELDLTTTDIYFTMPSSFDPAKDIGDLTGKTILVTGGNAGLGKATVQALAAHNAKCIYLCCRRRSSGDALVTLIHETQPKANVVVLELDLADLESVNKCAAELKRATDRLDILILNAGVSSTPYQKTQQGYEYQYVVFPPHQQVPR